MGYWNPFGWSEDTRRSIQSIVRPVMQVASMAASMGAFKGGGEKGGTTGEADSDAAPTLPEGVVPGTEGIGITDIGPDGSMTESFMPDSDGSLAMPDGSQLPPSQQYQTSPTMSVPDQVTQASFDPYATTDPLGSSANRERQYIDLTMDQGISPQEAWNTTTQNLTDSPSVHTGMGGSGEDIQSLEVIPHTQQPIGGEAPALTGDPVSPQPGVKPKPTQQPGEPPATKTPNNEPPKSEGEDGPGPGGKEKGFLEAFNWKNIQEFLASDEGKKWMLSDEGLFGIGQKLTAAAEHGTSTFTALTLKERKKLLDRLKKERAERKEKEKEKEKEKNK